MKSVEKKYKKCMERRYSIVAYIKAHNFAHYTELADVFEISEMTLMKDLNFLRDIMKVPIKAKHGCDGFIYIEGGWNVLIRYLDEDEQYTLVETFKSEFLTLQQRMILIEILKKFGYPNVSRELKKEIY